MSTNEFIKLITLTSIYCIFFVITAHLRKIWRRANTFACLHKRLINDDEVHVLDVNFVSH